MKFIKSNRSAFTNFLTARYERMTGETALRSYPSYLILDPCSICQLRCPVCPTGIENENRRTGGGAGHNDRCQLSQELFDAIMDEMGEYLFLVKFYNWGEPLLNKKLPGFIRKAKKLDIRTEVHTNLSLKLSDEFLEELLLSGIDEIAASIDGFSQDTYSTYRVGGDFELARKNIVRLAELRDRLGLDNDIRWNFIVFSFNEHDVDAAKAFCEGKGILFSERECYTINPDWLPSYRAEEKERMLAHHRVVQDDKTGSGCAWLYRYTSVNPDGTVSPCCALWNQKAVYGKIVPGVQEFADVWNNSYYRKARMVMSGREAKGLSGTKTECEVCKLGSVKELYSNLDYVVEERFREVFKGSEPELGLAFNMLNSGVDSSGTFEPFKQYAEIHGLKKQVKLFETELSSVYHSKSWRWTYPVRWITSRLKGTTLK
jgi:MoaA/NifB/PqqE/SkfB family radical SAM enzyme